MFKSYSYPRVDITTKVLSRYNPVIAQDTTTLFVPFVSEKGPENVIVRIHSLDEFINKFGKLSYENNRLVAYNIYNWLSNGGTVYAYRLFQNGELKNDVFTLYNSGEVKKSEGYIYTDKKEEEEKVPGQTGGTGTTEGETQTPQTPEQGENTGTNEAGISRQAETNEPKLSVTAKYFGKYYDNISLEIVKSSETSLTFNVLYIDPITKRVTVLERFVKRTLSNWEDALAASDYILFTDDAYVNSLFADKEKGGLNVNEVVLIKFSNATDCDDQDTLTEYFWKYLEAKNPDNSNKTIKINAAKVLGNPLETPVELILDAGYNLETKKAMMNFIADSSDNAVRTDIVGIFDCYTGFNKLTKPEPVAYSSYTDENNEQIEATNIAVYEQYFTISDGIFCDRDIYVTPSYFLSKLISYNDMQYGPQASTAGLNRGVLEDAIAIHADINSMDNANPTPDDKEQLFKARINYAEKTPREYSFECQRTFDGSGKDETKFTALSFLNNIRCLQRMKHELVRLGRSYLFEFNDSITLSKMSSVLNKYMNEWVSNRTLNYAYVNVQKNPYSDEAVDVTMDVRFTGTIEVISVEITIR